MKLRVITVRWDPGTGKFDDRELQEFQADKEILEVTDYTFLQERIPTWGLLIRYREAPSSGSRAAKESRRDWRAEVPPEGRPLFDALRQWRLRSAQRDGVPTYLILNNREMVDVATRRPRTLQALQAIPGIGEAKSRRWGGEILEVIAQVSEAAPEPEKAAETREGAPETRTDGI